MTLSTGPWWCAPVLALGWITTVPAQSFSAPIRAWVIAAARFMPGVCAVLMSSSFERTTRTPECFHLDSAAMARIVCSREFAIGSEGGGDELGNAESSEDTAQSRELDDRDLAGPCRAPPCHQRVGRGSLA